MSLHHNIVHANGPCSNRCRKVGSQGKYGNRMCQLLIRQDFAQKTHFENAAAANFVIILEMEQLMTSICQFTALKCVRCYYSAQREWFMIRQASLSLSNRTLMHVKRQTASVNPKMEFSMRNVCNKLKTTSTKGTPSFSHA